MFVSADDRQLAVAKATGLRTIDIRSSAVAQSDSAIQCAFPLQSSQSVVLAQVVAAELVPSVNNGTTPGEAPLTALPRRAQRVSSPRSGELGERRLDAREPARTIESRSEQPALESGSVVPVSVASYTTLC